MSSSPSESLNSTGTEGLESREWPRLPTNGITVGVNSLIELHDSVVSAMAEHSGSIAVTFSPAYFHRSPGQPGIDPGSGWIQDSILWLGEGVLSGTLPDFPCAITDGELSLGPEVHRNGIPVPLARHAIVTLRVVFYGDCKVHIRGKSARVELLGDPRYVDEFRP